MKNPFTILLLGLFFANCNRGKLCKCDNQVQYLCDNKDLYSQNDEAIKSTDLTVKNSINILNKVSDSSSVETKQKVEVLVTKLNEIHSFYLDVLNRYTLLVTHFPCNQVYQNKYIAVLDNFSNLKSSLENIDVKNSAELNEVESTVTKAAVSQANIEAAKKGISDTTKLDNSQKANLSKVNNILNSKTFWVYFGQLNKDKSKWLTKNFILNKDSLALNARIISSTDLTKRDAIPVGSGDNWTLGNVVGYLSKNTTVIILEVTEIEDQNIWVKVQL